VISNNKHMNIGSWLQAKWLYGGDPFEPLHFAKPLEQFKQRLSAEGVKAVLSPLIQKYILDNPHRVTIELQVGALPLL
jgi:Zn-dependent M16 (insulinase) family peptidase